MAVPRDCARLGFVSGPLRVGLVGGSWSRTIPNRWETPHRRRVCGVLGHQLGGVPTKLWCGLLRPLPARKVFQAGEGWANLWEREVLRAGRIPLDQRSGHGGHPAHLSLPTVNGPTRSLAGGRRGPESLCQGPGGSSVLPGLRGADAAQMRPESSSASPGADGASRVATRGGRTSRRPSWAKKSAAALLPAPCSKRRAIAASVGSLPGVTRAVGSALVLAAEISCGLRALSYSDDSAVARWLLCQARRGSPSW